MDCDPQCPKCTILTQTIIELEKFLKEIQDEMMRIDKDHKEKLALIQWIAGGCPSLKPKMRGDNL